MARTVPEEVPVRLYDRVRHADPTLPDVPVIDASAIAEQIEKLETTADESYPAADYGIVAPPFRGFFVEARTRIADPGNPRVHQEVDRGMLSTI